MTVNEFIQNNLNNPSRISHQVTNPTNRIHSSPLSLHRKSVYHPGTGGNRLLGCMSMNSLNAKPWTPVILPCLYACKWSNICGCICMDLCMFAYDYIYIYIYTYIHIYTHILYIYIYYVCVYIIYIYIYILCVYKYIYIYMCMIIEKKNTKSQGNYF